MKKSIYPFLFMLVFLSFQSCKQNGSKQAGDSTDSTGSAMSMDSTSNPADTTSGDTNEFVLKAASGGMLEVELGNLAQKNAKSSRVKGFGAMMVKDHSKANDELKALAAQKNITLPTTLSPEHQMHLDELRKKTGKEFDQGYMEMMTKDHKDDIDEFQDAADDVKDADIKAFAAKTLPVLKVHLDSAKAISSAVKP